MGRGTRGSVGWGESFRSAAVARAREAAADRGRIRESAATLVRRSGTWRRPFRVRRQMFAWAIVFLQSRSRSWRHRNALLECRFRAASLSDVPRKHDHQRPTSRIGLANYDDALAELVRFPSGFLHQFLFSPIIRTGASTTANVGAQLMQPLGNPIQCHAYITGPSRLSQLGVHHVQFLLKIRSEADQVGRHDAPPLLRFERPSSVRFPRFGSHATRHYAFPISVYAPRRRPRSSCLLAHRPDAYGKKGGAAARPRALRGDPFPSDNARKSVPRARPWVASGSRRDGAERRRGDGRPDSP
jgi:hypothetical protein